jgi:hypothetical protein
MMGPMRNLGRLALATALLGASLSGCALLDGSSRLEEALEYLPADATTVTFVDRAAVADRVGDGEPETSYRTQLAELTAAMEDAAFSDADVEWEAIGTSEAGFARIWRMSDDLDFDTVATDLEDAGFERSGTPGRRVFHADPADAQEGLVGGRYPAPPYDIALVPDERLIVSGTNLADVLGAVTDDADSLADAGTFGDLLGQADHQDDLEYAVLTLDSPCGQEALDDEATGVGLFVPSDETVRAVHVFADDRTARAAADTTRDSLAAWLKSADVGIDPEVTTEGSAVRVEVGFAERERFAQSFEHLDGPLVCPAATPGA